jgi:hypothetical protein
MMIKQTSQKAQCVKKSDIIPIINNSFEKSQYSLHQNFFDPTKSSPPNSFMKKLYLRTINYDLPNNNVAIFDSK